jgi:hypothetical protein
MFEQKATKIWRESSEHERIALVDDLFRRCEQFHERRVFASLGKPRPTEDRYASLGIPGDPVFAVYAPRKGAPNPERRFPTRAGHLCAKIDAEVLKAKKARVKESLCCPYCDIRLQKIRMDANPFSSWDTDFMYVCFNDDCAFLIRGWETMFRQGNVGLSYRFMFHPHLHHCLSIPVTNLHALRESIID